MNIFSIKRRDPIFCAAKDKVNQLLLRINGQLENYSLDPNKWCRIVPNSDFSPAVLQIKEGMHLIFFPEDSAPYTHKAEGFDKQCHVRSGKIKDLISGKIFQTGDKFIIPANTEIRPVSLHGDAFAVVTYVEKSSQLGKV